MTDFSQILFRGGRATPLLLGRLRAKGAAIGLPDIRLTDDEFKATQAFSTWWGKAFPSRDDLPTEPLHDKEGRITVAFHRVFR